MNKKKIFLTGSSGFVGGNISKKLSNQYIFKFYNKNSKIQINEDIVIHSAGKAHDLIGTSEFKDYYNVNTEFTKNLFSIFLNSDAKVFITISSVKAVADNVIGELTEEITANPVTHYGKSKLLAEQFIRSKRIPEWKRVYILRPCMIYGPGNKGNLNLLYKLVYNRFPWLLGAFVNKRSYCSIDNLCFIIQELIQNNNIPSGTYNVADDESISTNELISLIAESCGRKPKIWNTSTMLIKFLAKIGDLLKLPLNTERLKKLTESYIVSNAKIKKVIGKPLPVNIKEGLLKTFKSYDK